MIFGSLSEKEVEKITSILEGESIEYRVVKDQSVLNSNKDSLNYNLRYLHGPNLSNNILAIEVDSINFKTISSNAKEKLLNFGITNEVPEEFIDQDFNEKSPEMIDLTIGQKRVVGLNYALCILVSAILIAIYVLKGKSLPW